MKKRVISAAALIAILLVFMLLSPIRRLILFTAAAVLAVREMVSVLSARGYSITAWPLYAYITGHALIVYFEVGAVYAAAWFFFIAVISFVIAILGGIERAQDAVGAIFVLVYPLMPFAVIMYFAVHRAWPDIFLLGFLSTWMCDAFAMFGGKWWGKHKASPTVSPNKTIEGCASGAAFSVLGGVIVFFLLKVLPAPAVELPLIACMVTALVASTFGQFGDLAASLIKRMTGVKDYSNLIPGHGGMMDRVDSLLFSVPATFFCLFAFGLI